MDLSSAEIARLSLSFEAQTPQEIIAWAVDTFCPEIAASSSFQTQSVPLLHMISQIRPEMRIFFLDTHYHFWDTLMFREQLERELNLNVVELYPSKSWWQFLHRFGRSLVSEDPDLCCFIRKVEPMQKGVVGLKAWITGIRRDQTSQRASARILELQPDGLLKVNPMLNWTRADVADYMQTYNLPEHPMTSLGYPSIGCMHCTSKVKAGQDERSGRWVGKGKTECGLHTHMFQEKKASPDDMMGQFVLAPDPKPQQEEK
ncbi:MAG TPA: phosphoadenylyl-sulfate reductase [Chloroflexi bacterium]|nr:phosphoadenylyl-sulfate reductase [Chloroflexota bacterium]